MPTTSSAQVVAEASQTDEQPKGTRKARYIVAAVGGLITLQGVIFKLIEPSLFATIAMVVGMVIVVAGLHVEIVAAIGWILHKNHDACLELGMQRERESQFEVAAAKLKPVVLQVHGRQGKTVSVDGATVRIIKEGGLFASQREKAILIRNISSVEVKEPGGFAGFIQFSIAGGVARNSSHTFSGGSFDAVGDENSVVFGDRDSYQTALKIKQYVETYQEKSSSSGSPTSAADEIVKLKALMDQGIITPEEFATKKRRLIES
ncbi:MAG: SHOCT domain-containing protein [Planctomycetia bacterium]|nr:SHOCT domain-containing protein [Planctomycetia bacterium]